MVTVRAPSSRATSPTKMAPYTPVRMPIERNSSPEGAKAGARRQLVHRGALLGGVEQAGEHDAAACRLDGDADIARARRDAQRGAHVPGKREILQSLARLVGLGELGRFHQAYHLVDA